MDAAEDLVAFCHREYPRLVGALTVHTGDRELACDLAQEALARACARWDEVGGMLAPGMWVYRVALNLSASHFRRVAVLRRVQRLLGSTQTDGAESDVAEVLAVREAVAGLPARLRTAVVLRHVLGLSVEETAEVMGLTPGSVRTTTSRAHARLRRVLESGSREVERAHRP